MTEGCSRERYKRIKVLVNSCIGMKKCRKICAARLRKEWRHVMNKFRGAASMQRVHKSVFTTLTPAGQV